MANDENVIGDQPLTKIQRDALVVRMKSAWSSLAPDQQNQLKPMLDEAHQQLSRFILDGTPPNHELHSVLRLKSYLTDDWDGQIRALNEQMLAVTPKTKGLRIIAGPGGEILGTGKYEELDPLWELVAGTVWLENILHRHPFPPGEPRPVEMPDDVTIALAGDFGTGNFGAGDSPSTRISKFIPSLNPHITIHLGDVYYAGTNGEEDNKLITYWPQGSIASFTLNSNHEMYSGGGPYFNEAVGGPVFNKYQSPYSFFALENASWVIVGLDSAYDANSFKLYMDGSIGKTVQPAFLQKIARRAHDGNKKVIVLTHHNGLPENGNPKQPQKLFTQVMAAFAGLNPPQYWYWGHVHAGIAYQPLGNGLLCRCLGHAALPWGQASELKSNPNVHWYENRNAKDPSNPIRVYNGFVFLEMKGPVLTENFYDETGAVAWCQKISNMNRSAVVTMASSVKSAKRGRLRRQHFGRDRNF